jgi:hypothetical protein
MRHLGRRGGWGALLDTVDVLLTPSLRRVYLIDFGPCGPSTDPLLFEWDELLDGMGVSTAPCAHALLSVSSMGALRADSATAARSV